MTQNKKNHDDTKLLLAVAAVVVVGAAGVALIAGLHESGDRTVKARALPRTPAAAAPVTAQPAMAPVRDDASPPAEIPASLEKLGGSTVTEEIVAATEESFVIEPGTDLVAEGLAAWRGRDYGRASDYFRARVDQGAADGWTHYMLGLSLWKNGALEPSAAALRRSAEIAPNSVRTWVNLSRVEIDRGEYGPALEAAEAALAVDADDAQAWFLQARSLYNQSRTAEAEEALEYCIGLDPDNGHAHNLLGLIRIDRGDAVNAADALARAAEIVPDVAYIQNNLGMALELSGRRDEAIVAYRRALEIDPAHAKATQNLARLEPARLDPDLPEPVDGETHVAALIERETTTAADESPVEGLEVD